MKINKSIFRIIKENTGQYLGMILLTVFSVLLFVSLTLTAQNLYVSKKAYVKNNVQEDLEFYSFNKIDNIGEIEEEFRLKMDETLVSEYSFGEKTVRLFTPNEKVNIPAVLEGDLPSKGEIAFDPAFAKANGYNVGDIFIKDNRNYVVSGIITMPNYAYILQKRGDLFNNPEFFGLGVLSKDDFSKGVYLYSVKYDNTQKNIYEQAKPLKAYLNEQGVEIFDWEYAKYNIKISTLDLEVKGIIAYSIIFPTIFMLIAAVLIAIVQGRMVKLQMKNIGTLYAMGYRKKDIMAHYLRYPIIIASIGGVIGGVMGMFALKPIMDLMLDYFPIPLKALSYNPLYLIIGIVLCCIAFCTGCYVSLNNVLKRSPTSIMKNEQKVKKINIVERKLNLSNMKFKRKFAIREQLRSLPRLAFLVFGIMIATVFLIYGFVAKSSFDYLINQEGNDVFHNEFEYVMKKPEITEAPKGGEIIAGWHFVPENHISDKFELLGAVQNSQMLMLKNEKGERLEVDDDTFIITSTMAKKYKLEEGDELSFIDMINDQQYKISITHIADTKVGDFVVTSLERFDEIMGWEKGSYNAIMSNEPLDIPQAIVYEQKTSESTSKMLGKYLALIQYFVYGIAVVAFILGLIVLYIIASINIDENKGYIALMKVFGYKGKEVNSMMLNHSRIFVVIGYLLGVPLGYAVMRIIFTIVQMMDINMEVRLEVPYIFIGFIIIVLTFEASKVICARKINKIPFTEALKGQRE